MLSHKVLAREPLKFQEKPSTQFMYIEDGSWTDFVGEVLGSIRTRFEEGKVVMEVRIGEIMYLFHLYRMLQIDLESENQRSIAWIDVEGKWFVKSNQTSSLSLYLPAFCTQTRYIPEIDH